MKETYQDIIDDFVLGKMPEQDRKDFEQEMANNPELKEQVEFTKTISDTLKSRNEKLDKMSEWNRKPSKKPVYWISSIAAVLVVGFVITQLYNTGSTIDSSGPIPTLTGVRGGNDYYEITQMIEEGKSQEALKRIETEEKANLEEENKLKQDTIFSLEQVEYGITNLANKNEKLKWLKANALIRTGQTEDAKQLLDEIVNSEGLYQEVADSLRKTL